MIPKAHAQTGFDSWCGANVPDGSSLLQQCRFDENFLQQAILPFEAMTGGFLSMIFWGVITMVIYLKYHNSMLALLAGSPVLVMGAVALPEGAAKYITMMAAGAVCVTIFIMWWKIPRD